MQRWFLRRPEYVLHFTPTGGSWLNQVERFFAEITTKWIRRGAFRSVPALEAAIRDDLECHNVAPKPSAWTADADLILRRVKRVCEWISDSGHCWTLRNRPTRTTSIGRCRGVIAEPVAVEKVRHG